MQETRRIPELPPTLAVPPDFLLWLGLWAGGGAGLRDGGGVGLCVGGLSFKEPLSSRDLRADARVTPS